MLNLHHLNNSRSFRILWLLEELELDYKLTSYERTKSYLAPESLKKFIRLVILQSLKWMVARWLSQVLSLNICSDIMTPTISSNLLMTMKRRGKTILLATLC